MMKATTEATDMGYKGRKVEDIIDDNIRETATLAANVENLSQKLNEQKTETNSKFDKIVGSLDEIKGIVQEGFKHTDLVQQEHRIEINLLKKENEDKKQDDKKKFDWKLALMIGFGGPVVGVVVDILLHHAFGLK